jgi:hypothetical protein
MYVEIVGIAGGWIMIYITRIPRAISRWVSDARSNFKQRWCSTPDFRTQEETGGKVYGSDVL